MSEYIVELDSKHSVALMLAFAEEMRGGDFVREEIVRCRDCTRYIPQGTYRFNSGVVNKDTCEVIRGFVVQIDPDGFCAWGKRKGDDQ